jgi:hypothetical protein
MSDIKELLEELKTINDKDIFDVFVPSLNKKVPFRSFSVKQHKDIIKTALDGISGSVLVNKVFNDIIKENSTKEYAFSVYDRNKILIDLRQQSISDNFKYEDKDYKLSELPEYSFEFTTSETFSYKGITINVEMPSLDVDSTITEKCAIEINKLTSEEKKINTSINLLLIYELIKFIKTIKTGTGEINFSDLNIYERRNIVEALPLRLNNEVLDYITRYKQYEQELLTFSDGTKLIIDASFLTGE